jgi:serine/threonine-protein kinase RsbW
MNRTFPASASALTAVRAFIRERADEVSFFPEVADDLVLAVSEACTNAVLHSRSSQIEVTWRPLEDGAEVRVRDAGVFQRPPLSSDWIPSHGFGIPIMKSLVNEVSIEGGTEREPGTLVRLVMRKRPRRRSSDVSA